MEQALKIVRENKRLISDLVGPAWFALAGLISFGEAALEKSSYPPDPFFAVLGLYFLGHAGVGASAALNRAADRKEKGGGV